MFAEENQNYFGKVRITSPAEDPLALRLRLQSLLSSTTLEVPCISPAAIVCIRRLIDPKPHSLKFAGNEVAQEREWSQALTEKINQMAGRASKPRDVNANSDVVVFADKAELMAYFIDDWLNGRIVQRWWWQVLLKQKTASEIVREFWRRTPQYIPATMDQLEKKRSAVRFAATYLNHEAAELLINLCQCFNLYRIALLVNNIGQGTQRSERKADETPSATAVPAARFPLEAVRSKPPWHRVIPEDAVQSLTAPQAMLLGISLTIHREPALVRSGEFASELKHWQEEIVSLADERQSQPVTVQPRKTSSGSELSAAREASWLSSSARAEIDSVTHLSDGSRTNAQLLSSDANAIASSSTPIAIDADTQFLNAEPAEIKKDAGITMPTTALDFVEPRTKLLDENTPERSGNADSSEVISQPANVASEPGAAVQVPQETESLPASLDLDDGITVHTRVGGLFYLINLALYLDLYPDFTRPADAGIDLSIWHFLSLVGTELLRHPFEADPIWSLLDTLAGGDRVDSFDPDDEWRIPLSWLEAFEMKQPLVWSQRGGRLRLSHPDDFLILDLSLEPDAMAQLERELEQYRSGSPSLSILPATSKIALSKLHPETRLRTSVAIQRWLRRLVPYVRARLRRALGVARTVELSKFLTQPARVFVTPAHIDVFFALAELPIELRLAGLDRDPGWVPDAGHFIAFHYE